jgi:hypothetical protein
MEGSYAVSGSVSLLERNERRLNEKEEDERDGKQPEPSQLLPFLPESRRQELEAAFRSELADLKTRHVTS